MHSGGRIKEVFSAFLLLGLTSFGGLHPAFGDRADAVRLRCCRA